MTNTVVASKETGNSQRIHKGVRKRPVTASYPPRLIQALQSLLSKLLGSVALF
jgi:hypothetical protein